VENTVGQSNAEGLQGLQPKMLHWVYAIVICILIYAVLVWWLRTEPWTGELSSDYREWPVCV
jgi:hypothetical protein